MPPLAGPRYSANLHKYIKTGDIIILRNRPVRHVLLVIGTPVIEPTVCSKVNSEAWAIETIESTRHHISKKDLRKSYHLFTIDDKKQLRIYGEINPEEMAWDWFEIVPHVVVDVIHQKVCHSLNEDIVKDVLLRLCKCLVQKNWSKSTAVRAGTRLAKINSDKLISSPEKTHEIISNIVNIHWKRKPICTSVAIIFWQMYIFLQVIGDAEKFDSGDYHDNDIYMAIGKSLSELMPIYSDRCLPSELKNILLGLEITDESTITRLNGVSKPWQLLSPIPVSIVTGGDSPPVESRLANPPADFKNPYFQSAAKMSQNFDDLDDHDKKSGFSRICTCFSSTNGELKRIPVRR